jgi:hypothetical protein
MLSCPPPKKPKLDVLKKYQEEAEKKAKDYCSKVK